MTGIKSDGQSKEYDWKMQAERTTYKEKESNFTTQKLSRRTDGI